MYRAAWFRWSPFFCEVWIPTVQNIIKRISPILDVLQSIDPSDWTERFVKCGYQQSSASQSVKTNPWKFCWSWFLTTEYLAGVHKEQAESYVAECVAASQRAGELESVEGGEESLKKNLRLSRDQICAMKGAIMGIAQGAGRAQLETRGVDFSSLTLSTRSWHALCGNWFRYWMSDEKSWYSAIFIALHVKGDCDVNGFIWGKKIAWWQGQRR